MDTRNFANGSEIPSEGYCDQPYVVKADDSAWVCIMTTGSGHEGQPGQHVVTMRSTDMGKTWEGPVDVEPVDGPEASYAVIMKVPGGRLYCFYNHNTDNLREVIADKSVYRDGKCRRVDSLGYFVFKYSDDHGRSWSEKRTAIPVREMEIDRKNPYSGKIRFFWNIGRPFVRDGAAYVPLHKVGGFGAGFMTSSEGVLLKSENILTQRDPEKIVWETLPDGDVGLRTPPGGGPVSDEHNCVVMDDGSIYCSYRCTDGHPVEAYSRDGGHTWEKPRYAAYTPGGHRLKHPRACPPVWKAFNGKYLRWFHNNGHRTYNSGAALGSRNVAWLSGGVEKNGYIHWSQPEIGVYVDGYLRGCSYPDFIEENGRYFFTTTQKTEARVLEIDRKLLEGIWNQDDLCEVAQDGLVLDLSEEDCQAGSLAPAPRLPSLIGKDFPLEGRGGFTIDFWIRFDDLAAGQVILDSRDASGKGFALTTTNRQTIRFNMCDGWSGAFWECDRWMLSPDTDHHVAVIVDGGPKVISFVIDGILCDGGEDRLLGWGRFISTFRDANGSEQLTIALSLHGRLKRLRIYNRYLRTSEAIGNFHART
jgi:hypothetical protein